MTHKLTPIEQGMVVESIKRGDSFRSVGRRFGIHKNTVKQLYDKFLRTGAIKREIGSGKPKIWSLTDATALKNHVLTSRQGTVAEAHSVMQLRVSRRTAQRMMNSTGYRAMKKTKKPALDESHVKKRLDYALKHRDWTVEDWKKVLWTDETKVNLAGSDGVQYYWDRQSHKSKVIPERGIKKTKKFGGGGVMIWSCFGWDGVGWATRIEGNINGKMYLAILKDEMVKSIAHCIPEELETDWILMHDGAKCHKALDVTTWLEDKDIPILDHPPQSPDLNPIENLWALVKAKIYAKKSSFETKEELFQTFAKEYYSTSVQLCRKLISSMSNRISAVIEAEGHYIKY